MTDTIKTQCAIITSKAKSLFTGERQHLPALVAALRIASETAIASANADKDKAREAWEPARTAYMHVALASVMASKASERGDNRPIALMYKDAKAMLAMKAFPKNPEGFDAEVHLTAEQTKDKATATKRLHDLLKAHDIANPAINGGRPAGNGAGTDPQSKKPSKAIQEAMDSTRKATIAEVRNATIPAVELVPSFTSTDALLSYIEGVAAQLEIVAKKGGQKKAAKVNSSAINFCSDTAKAARELIAQIELEEKLASADVPNVEK